MTTVAPKEARNLARSTVQQVASDIAKDAADMAPRDSGDLKRSIKARRRNANGSDQFESIVHVLPAAFYWRFLEYGQGPDGVEYAMFLKALNKYKADGQQRHLDAFAKVLERRIKRAMKRG
ncbi:HK97 gp10 family phage protein [Neotabrizicola sp. sgz301269]|uniref:HK97 gp10 family phage protein n=1 Tax=Neotabrizicola sp. sgz301269 TaxID=3276282 RepID=UPI00376F610E